jgi:outer membrane lipopolysaccharide assembly protein LptE/RlpB
MKKLFIGLVSAVFILLMLLSGCGHDLKSAQGIAEEFVDQHYVNIDIPKAKQYAVGLALEKLNEEIRLTAGQTIDASTQKPRINYRLLEKKDGESRASFLYEGTIRSDDGSSFTRKWLIAVRKEANQWRVSNFSESD